MTAGGCIGGYGETKGLVYDPNLETKDGFIAHGGVYFMKLLIPKTFQRTTGILKQGFAGHGVGA